MQQLDNNLQSIDELSQQTSNLRNKVKKINNDYANDEMDFLFHNDDKKQLDEK